MNKSDFLKDIYSDFYGVEKENSKNEIEEQINYKDYFSKIDEYKISSDAKNLLKQIIEYMRKYSEKLEKNYINFSMIIENNDQKETKEIIKTISSAAKEYEYINKYDLVEISLYDADKKPLDEVYEKNGIILLKDLDGFSHLDEKEKSKFINDLENNIDSNTITIILAKENEYNNFFLGYDKLKENNFSFVINYQKPDIQDIYQSILEKIELDEEMKIKLLDYITNTISEVTDSEAYQDYLIRELSFHKRVPEIKKEKTLDEIFAELNELVGLKNVKKVLHDLVDLINLKNKTKDDLKLSNVNLHMVFLGNPGTGKTTVARIVSSILYNLKYIKNDKLIEVSSKDLVAEYVGQTAPKTNAVINKALGGVLFIDEAYSLAVKNDNSYNAEAIATLIQAMENHRDELVVIFAGYTKEMQAFLDSNSGITSRIGYTLVFEDYTEDELVEIFKNMATKAGFNTEEDAIEKLRDIIKENKDHDNFGNARFIRNIFEKTVIKHASNTKNIKNKEKLKTITEKDINTDNLLM